MRALIKQFDSVGMFLIETKCDDATVGKIMRSIGFSHFLSVSAQGYKGGLGFCWLPNLKMKILLCSHNIIHLLSSMGDDHPPFFVL